MDGQSTWCHREATIGRRHRGEVRHATRPEQSASPPSFSPIRGRVPPPEHAVAWNHVLVVDGGWPGR